MSLAASASSPTRRCPVCQGGVTDPALDDARAVEWHLDNCLHGEEVHTALHTLLGVSNCCEAEDH
jgi:hypothetical protein